MKNIALILLIIPSFSFAGNSFTKIVCEPTQAAVSQEADVEIFFDSAVDATKPLVGRYELLGHFRLKDTKRNRVYERSDLKLYPMTSTIDVNLQGGAAGYLHVRLYPVFAQGQFSGHYQAQVFINDLDTKAYYNLTGSAQMPGLFCKVQ